MSESSVGGYELTPDVLAKLEKVGLTKEVLLPMTKEFSLESMRHYMSGLLGDDELDNDAGSMIPKG
ncbi:MAG: hypothetical protein ABII21_01445 [bacterium]